MLVYFSEIFGDLTLYLNNVEDFLLRNYKIKQNFYKTVQYPLVLLSFYYHDYDFKLHDNSRI